jgi:hypothetical protein
MVALAQEVNADAIVVTTLHFWRIVTITIFVPLITPFLANNSTGVVSQGLQHEITSVWPTAVALFLGLGAGHIASKAHVPGGDLLGPFLAVGGANLLGAMLGPLSVTLMHVSMVLIGIALGTEISLRSLRRLQILALPTGTLIVALVMGSVLFGVILSRLTSLDLITAVLSSMPGGATTMPVIAHDLGGDMRVVAAIHLLRLCLVFIALPVAIRMLVKRPHVSI